MIILQYYFSQVIGSFIGAIKTVEKSLHFHNFLFLKHPQAAWEVYFFYLPPSDNISPFPLFNVEVLTIIFPSRLIG